jgi:hypothetical protein
MPIRRSSDGFQVQKLSTAILGRLDGVFAATVRVPRTRGVVLAHRRKALLLLASIAAFAAVVTSVYGTTALLTQVTA